MDARGLTMLAATSGLVAGAVWLSETLDRKPEVTESTAAAIRAELSFFVEFIEDPVEREALSDKPVPLCIGSSAPLDFDLLEDRLARSFLRPVPIIGCRRRTVEGDFGMFGAMTYWFDETGEEAGQLRIKAVNCPTVRRCIVDIDSVGAGMRYEVERTGDNWTVTGQETRWIV
ncbi:hypothetical protein [Qipengyuania sp. ASV99]|uniref:hypothetical protein n=1 Tax=Qipengyuania sp. ASV99 TaxID=3399681 RepID=UPI003A4C775E